jgi:hypothetical protein
MAGDYQPLGWLAILERGIYSASAPAGQPPSGISNRFIVIERMNTDLLHQGNKGNEEFCLAPGTRLRGQNKLAWRDESAIGNGQSLSG